jgi:hypothetical protein
MTGLFELASTKVSCAYTPLWYLTGIYTTVATSEAVAAFPSESQEFSPAF